MIGSARKATYKLYSYNQFSHAPYRPNSISEWLKSIRNTSKHCYEREMAQIFGSAVKNANTMDDAGYKDMLSRIVLPMISSLLLFPVGQQPRHGLVRGLQSP